MPTTAIGTCLRCEGVAEISRDPASGSPTIPSSLEHLLVISDPTVGVEMAVRAVGIIFINLG